MYVIEQTKQCSSVKHEPPKHSHRIILVQVTELKQHCLLKYTSECFCSFPIRKTQHTLCIRQYENFS